MLSVSLCVVAIISSSIAFKIPGPHDDLHKPLKLAEAANLRLETEEFAKVKNLIQERKSALFTERIIGGSIVPPGVDTFDVIILHSGIWMCTGTLIAESFVLSSSSCFDNLDINFPVKVIAGAHDLKDNTTFQVNTADYLQLHGKYRLNSAAYDVAVISTLYPFILNANVSLVQLPNATLTASNYTNSQANVTGWGITSLNGTTALNLRSVPVTVLNGTVCANIYTNFTYFNRMMLCAGNPNEQMGPCRGDGPLIANGNIQIGILSARMDCDKSPAIYTLVSYFVGWINWAVSILTVTSNFE